jgi:hypothetical protein
MPHCRLARCWTGISKGTAGQQLLLGNVNNTLTTTRQLLGKRVPAATGTHAKVDVLLDYSYGNGVLMWFVPEYY